MCLRTSKMSSFRGSNGGDQLPRERQPLKLPLRYLFKPTILFKCSLKTIELLCAPSSVLIRNEIFLLFPFNVLRSLINNTHSARNINTRAAAEVPIINHFKLILSTPPINSHSAQFVLPLLFSHSSIALNSPLTSVCVCGVHSCRWSNVLI